MVARVAVPEKIIGLTRILDFFDRCPCIRSLNPPQAALPSAAQSRRATNCAVPGPTESLYTKGEENATAFFYEILAVVRTVRWRDAGRDWKLTERNASEQEKTIWEAALHIANSADGRKILYDIDPIKKVEGARKSAPTTTANSVPQNGNGVKHPVFAETLLTGEFLSDPRIANGHNL